MLQSSAGSAGGIAPTAETDAGFAAQHRRCLETLHDLHDYPDMPLTWNGDRARRFRERRRHGPLGACHRCGARHMAEIRN